MRAIAAVSALTLLVQMEFAVGILAGLGATALLATQTGAEARQQVLRGDKRLLGIPRSATNELHEPHAVEASQH